MTCHNRREKSVECLRALRAQALPGWNPGEESEKLKLEGGKEEYPLASPTEVSAFSLQPCFADTPVDSPAVSTFFIEVFLVDDGSTDGTAESVTELWPGATVIRGDGNLFWCGGMRLAWQVAAKTDPDYYLWLNDDTHLLPGALSQLLRYASAPDSVENMAISVANCRDPETGLHTYGGYQRLGVHPLILRQLPVDDSAPVEADTFNGNAVLIPRAVFKKVGGMGPFSHALGDLDYGYRVVREGGRPVMVPGYSAECEKGNVITYWRKGPGRIQRWSMLNHKKSGLPFRDWLHFARTHGGRLWPIVWVRPYLRVLLDL